MHGYYIGCKFQCALKLSPEAMLEGSKDFALDFLLEIYDTRRNTLSHSMAVPA